jgi:hypothetical protein
MTETKNEKLVEVELDSVISINGVAYAEGTHEVSSELAEELNRINATHNKYLAQLNKNVASNGNGGTRSAA